MHFLFSVYFLGERGDGIKKLFVVWDVQTSSSCELEMKYVYDYCVYQCEPSGLPKLKIWRYPRALGPLASEVNLQIWHPSMLAFEVNFGFCPGQTGSRLRIRFFFLYCWVFPHQFKKGSVESLGPVHSVDFTACDMSGGSLDLRPCGIGVSVIGLQEQRELPDVDDTAEAKGLEPPAFF